MPHASDRSWRNPWIALALTALGVGFMQGGANASPVGAAAAKPSLSDVSITPKSPTKGEGFKVSFTTKAGGQYVVFYSTGRSGGPLVEGKTKTGTITKRKLGKELRQGTYTIGVRVTVGSKTKEKLTKVTIKK
jgi:hypothetical protein